MNTRQNKKKRMGSRHSMLPGTSKQRAHNNVDKIPMSRQLKITKQTKRRKKRNPVKITMNNNKHIQGQPMPTLEDLEKMYDNPASSVFGPERCTCNNNNNASESTKSTHTINLDNPHRDDKNIPAAPSTAPDNGIQLINLIEPFKSINEGNGVIIIDDEPDITDQKRKRKLSSSANSPEKLSSPENEIKDDDYEKPLKLRKIHTETLLDNDDNGSDSDVTIVYDLEAAPIVPPISRSSPYNRFSPLPSTSTDSATIQENEKTFMESLSASKLCAENQETDTEQNSEMPIVIDDDDLPSVFDRNATTNSDRSLHTDNDDDVVITSSSNEVVDVNEIISFTRSFLSKFRTVDDLSAVHEVPPVENTNTTNNTTHDSNSNRTSSSRLPRTQKTNQSVRPTSPVIHPDILALSARISSTTANTATNIPNRNVPVTNSASNVASSSLASPVTTQQTSPEVSSGLSCPICLDNLRSRECASTLCGHIFCMDCIKRAIRSSRKCPTCRKNIKGNNGFHRLFL